MAWAEADLNTMFHLDPSSRLVTSVHQRHIKTGHTVRRDRQDNAPMAQGEPFYKRSPRNLSIGLPIAYKAISPKSRANQRASSSQNGAFLSAAHTSRLAFRVFFDCRSRNRLTLFHVSMETNVTYVSQVCCCTNLSLSGYICA